MIPFLDALPAFRLAADSGSVEFPGHDSYCSISFSRFLQLIHWFSGAQRERTVKIPYGIGRILVVLPRVPLRQHVIRLRLVFRLSEDMRLEVCSYTHEETKAVFIFSRKQKPK